MLLEQHEECSINEARSSSVTLRASLAALGKWGLITQLQHNYEPSQTSIAKLVWRFAEGKIRNPKLEIRDKFEWSKGKTFRNGIIGAYSLLSIGLWDS